jgi:hypothetical protein
MRGSSVIAIGDSMSGDVIEIRLQKHIEASSAVQANGRIINRALISRVRPESADQGSGLSGVG